MTLKFDLFLKTIFKSTSKSLQFMNGEIKLNTKYKIKKRKCEFKFKLEIQENICF